MNTKATKATKATKNTKKENAKLKRHLQTLKTACKNAREASQKYTAKIIYAFLLDSQDYKKTETKIRQIVSDSYGEDWETVKGSENRKIRYARVIFERRIEALKNCKNTGEVLHYLKTNQKELSHSKILNINTNQGKANQGKANQGKPNQGPEPVNYGKPNPVPQPASEDSQVLEAVAFIKGIKNNEKLIALMNKHLADAGIKIQVLQEPVRKAV